MENDKDSYEAAMEALSSLITKQKRGGDGSPKRGDKHQFMETYLKILDLEDSLDGLNIIHVAGTKGKGSTCSFSEAILRSCGFSTGLFTSPHLIDVRERYRINGYDISEEKFLEYFWYCWHKLKENTSDKLPMPPLFQFLTLLAFRIFSCEKVDVAIVEVGLGGRLDSTNVIKKPVVCGIASLGMDHMEILGNTLGKIASEKAGIFKAHVPAFTVPQPAEAMSVLQERASALGISLQVAQPLDPIQLANVKLGLAGDHQYTNAGLAVSLCRSWLQHMSQLQKLHLTSDGDATLPRAILEGLAATKLNGRAQVVHESTVRNSSEIAESNHGDLIFYLDGAHSPESMDVCARWFSHAVRDDQTATPDVKEKKEDSTLAHPKKIDKQVLLFNCMETRDPAVLLPHLVNTSASCGVHFSRALFVPSLSTYSKVGSATSSVPYRTSRDLSWQLNVQKTWDNIFRGKGSEQEVKPEEYPVIHQQETPPPHELLYGVPIAQYVPDGKAVPSSTVFSSLPLTINWLRECVKQNPTLRLRVLVTGSLHLVGDVLKLLRR